MFSDPVRPPIVSRAPQLKRFIQLDSGAIAAVWLAVPEGRFLGRDSSACNPITKIVATKQRVFFPLIICPCLLRSSPQRHTETRTLSGSGSRGHSPTSFLGPVRHLKRECTVRGHRLRWLAAFDGHAQTPPNLEVPAPGARWEQLLTTHRLAVVRCGRWA